ncbi:hypothetical protein LUZ60_010694 [Juncus effusus]|nr:hypothetical protein LUZ60_010694 [Juncus effusus]
MKAAPGDYLMQISIGTPALTFWAIADTGSDLIWTQCIPCTKCFAQPSPYFDPSKTSSFQKLPCSSNLCEALPQGDHTSCTASECGYYYSYVDTAYTKGYLATDTVGLGTVSIPKVGFGCGTYNVGNFGKSAGLVGLARGKLSLVTQIGAQKFSYCLASDQTKPSPLLFGSIATLTGSGVQNTPLITNRFYPTYYYLNLLGIFVGPTHVPILSGTLNPENGDGGLIIDSGTTFTFLERAGYSLVAQAFISQMKNYRAISGSKYGLDLCFQYPKERRFRNRFKNFFSTGLTGARMLSNLWLM